MPPQNKNAPNDSRSLTPLRLINYHVYYFFQALFLICFFDLYLSFTMAIFNQPIQTSSEAGNHKDMPWISLLPRIAKPLFNPGRNSLDVTYHVSNCAQLVCRYLFRFSIKASLLIQHPSKSFIKTGFERKTWAYFPKSLSISFPDF